jgi:hypothetical protein
MTRSKNIILITLTLVVGVLLGSLVIAGPQSKRKPAVETGVIIVETRQEYTVDELEGVRDTLLAVSAVLHDLAALGEDSQRQELCLQAIDSLDTLSLEQLAVLAESRPQLDALLVATANLSHEVQRNEKLRGGREDIRPLSPGFPSAPYSSLCGSTRPPTGVVFAALLARTAAEAAQLGAQGACNQVVVALCNGGNSSIACTVLDIAVAVTRGIEDGLTFCSDDIDSAEIRGTLDRTDHMHRDIEVLDEKLDMIIDQLEKLRVLSCQTIRLVNTPEGLRFEDCPTCSDQPLFPYDWPEPDIRRELGHGRF